MAQGTQRRGETQDSLAGANQIQPTPRQAPSISGSANARGPELINSNTARTLGKLQSWGGPALAQKVAAKREKSDMAGRVAFEQGRSFDDLQMDGDKYALQGYRVLQAQTASSSLFAQQKQAIQEGGYENSPEEYAEAYAQSLEDNIKDLDPLTAQMVKENMTKQMPQLVGAHMSLHLQDQEKKAFSSLATSINVMSQDDTADDDLLLNALGGPDAPSGGLSSDRRIAAVVEGTVLAFQDGNPKAYAKLIKTGVLEGLDSGQVAKLQSAEAAFQREEASKVNTAWMTDETAILTRVAAGDLAPADAVNHYVNAATKYGYEVSAQKGRAVYLSAKAAQEYNEKGDAVLIKEAALRKDHATIAALTEPFMVDAESGGDPDALSPVGAMGTHQVMPATMADPGYGIKPADITDPTDVARVGKEYWAKMISGSAGHSSLTWEPGDVEAAAIAYNAGPANAAKWIAAGRDYSVLPKREETEPYAKKILARAKGEGLVAPKDRLVAAKKLKEQTEERINLAAHERYQTTQLDIDTDFAKGRMSDEEYLTQSNAAREGFKVERTKATTHHLTSVMDKTHTDLKTKVEDDRKDLVDARYAEISNAFERAMGKAEQPDTYYERVTQEHIAKVATLYAKEGYSLADMGYSGIIDHSTKQLATALDKYDKWNIEQNRIERASATNTVDSLEPTLQKRAFKQVTDGVGQNVADAVAEGKVKQEDAPELIKQALETNYLSMGLVDPQVKRESIAALGGELMDSKGAINTGAAKVLESYARLKRANPRVANTMFDEATRYKADAIISAGGGIDAPIQNGITRFTQSQMGVGNIDFSDPKIRTETSKRINRAVNGFWGFGGIVRDKDVGVVQVLFGDAERGDERNRSKADREVLRSDETADLLQGYIEAEVFRMAKHQPGADPQYLVDGAVETVTRLTDVVGGNVVKMQDGYGLKNQLFGNEVQKYDKSDIVNEVIVDHLRELAKSPEYSFLTKTSLKQALLPFGKDVDSPRDVTDINRVGVRPYDVISSGRNFGIQVSLQTGGSSEIIWLDLPTVGQEYKDRYATKFQDDDVPTE